MVAAYLYLNAGLYLLLSLWCSLRWRDTSRALGFTTLSHSGQSEYLVVYGGLQLGLAIGFFLLARDPALHRFGMLFSLALYAAIVAFRVPTAIAFAPVGPTTWMVAGLEVLLFAGAAGLVLAMR
ncbi:MAG TPA: DUF4345 domain-containing protein [Xanthomonadales bacterium]|nr:DUF4345 domain-containing protein [Xanthomonadales bacterium]